MLHAPITDLPSRHGALNPGRKLLVGGGPHWGPGRAEQAVRVVSRSSLSWALCGDSQPTELFKVACNLCALATWPRKGFGRRKAVRAGRVFAALGKDWLPSQPSVGSADLRTLQLGSALLGCS